uniref:Uncharacterized protein n=1 Tax=Anguilla anguilla TaxID=7936 RepID=A0A0E9PBZ3_ANGAN
MNTHTHTNCSLRRTFFIAAAVASEMSRVPRQLSGACVFSVWAL